MAEPLKLDIAPRNYRAELADKLEQAPIQHAEALLSGYELLQELHDSGVLELLHGVLGAGDKVIETAVDSANKPASIRAIRNLLILSRTLQSIDPDVLERVAGAVPGVIAAIDSAHSAKAPSLPQSIRLVLSSNTRRGLAAIYAAFDAVRSSVNRHDRR